MHTVSKTVYASAARTATPTAVSQNTTGANSIHVIIDVTAIVTAPSIVVTLDAYDNVSGKWYNLLTSAAITTVSTNVLKIGPGLPVTANLSANDIVPENVRVTVTHGNANSITYSVGMSEIA